MGQAVPSDVLPSSSYILTSGTQSTGRQMAGSVTTGQLLLIYIDL